MLIQVPVDVTDEELELANTVCQQHHPRFRVVRSPHTGGRIRAAPLALAGSAAPKVVQDKAVVAVALALVSHRTVRKLFARLFGVPPP